MAFRILIPDELPYSSGVENVVVAIVREWLPEVDSITWIVRNTSRSSELEKRFDHSPKLKFETFFKETSTPAKLPSRVFGMLKAAVKKLPILRDRAEAAYRRILDSRIAEVARDSDSTHCWFHFVQGQSMPVLKIPVCGLVHDQNFRFFPENLPQGKSLQFEGALKQWLREADMMSVLSEKGKREMLELNPAPRATIEIIPNAITPSSSENFQRNPAQEPLFFYPAAALSHKNHLLLFQAAHLIAKAGKSFRIVICGKETEDLLQDQPMENPGVESARLFFQQHKAIMSGHLEALGQCSMNRVNQLYAECWAVVLPSRYEGFGLPLVESLARNAPVLCSHLTPFKEQVERYHAKEWVKWFSPDDSTQLAQLLENSINNPPKPNTPRFPTENLSAWTWKHVAHRYLELFEVLKRQSTLSKES